MNDEYVFLKACSWKDHHWVPGDRLKGSDHPRELVETLLRIGNIERVRPADAPRTDAPPLTQG